MVQEQILENFTRRTKVLASIMTMEQAVPCFARTLPKSLILKNIRLVSGLETLSEEYIERAIMLYLRTRKFVEDSEYGDSGAIH